MLEIKIAPLKTYPFPFSVCSLVTNAEEYEDMKASFIKAGFADTECEFLCIDNIAINQLDAYRGINRFLHEANGEYIIICHQDILMSFDNRAILEKRLEELNKFDPDWALCGNAGAAGPNHIVFKIAYDQDSIHSKGKFPQQAFSLDENFMVIKNAANLALSNNLSGFHLYATDLCLVADILGYSAYVIDFAILHKSRGNPGQDFTSTRKNLQKKYKKALRGRFIQTTITRFYISGSGIENFFYNSPVIFLIRMWNGFKKRIRK